MKKLTAFLLALVAILAAPAALAAAATQFRVTPLPSTIQAGTAISTVVVEAVDGAGVVDSTFTGTVTFSSSDSRATRPADFTFAGSDAGKKLFSDTFILRTAGSQTITASSTTSSLQGTSPAITVTGGPAATISVTAPATAAVDVPFSVALAARDAFGNTASTYAGTARITSTDPSAASPAANATFAAGAATASAILKSEGTWTITATDTVTSTITGTSGSIAVTKAPAIISTTPTSLDFGGQSMKTTAPAQTITITNTGGAATSVTSVTASTNFSVVTHNCATLNPNASCTANVTFTPGTEGALTGTLTIASGIAPKTVSLAGTGEKSLVTHYYRSILRRAPEAGGKAFWESEATRLTSLGANVNETWYAMATSFYFSPEYLAFARSNADFVTDLYNTFFNRAPDAGDLSFWTGQIAAGMPREVVLTNFLFSGEFVSFTRGIFGTATVRPEIDMVVDFYRGILGRLPDDTGFNNYLTQLRNSQCAGPSFVSATVELISSQFALSAEYSARNRTTSQYVGDLYNTLLRRGGELAGVQFWIDEINSGRRSREEVRKFIVAGSEFSARVNATIAASCFSSPDVVDTDINGTTIPAPTGPAGERMCEPAPPRSPGAGPGPCGAYEIPIGKCSSGMTGPNALTKAYLYVLEDYTPTSPRLGNTIRFGLQRDHAMVFRFKTGPVSAFPQSLQLGLNKYFGFSFEEFSNWGPQAAKFVTISESKCDFDYSKTLAAGALNGCFNSMGGGGSLSGLLSPTGFDPTVGFPICQMRPNTTYYLNMRYEDTSTVSNRGVISCPAGVDPRNTCGQIITMN